LRNRTIAFIFATDWFLFIIKCPAMKNINIWFEWLRTLWENRFNELDKLLFNLKTKDHEQQSPF